jgi:hypothetical protein
VEKFEHLYYQEFMRPANPNSRAGTMTRYRC